MVSLSEVQASNARIASTLPARLVAVFVGATSGIGETTLKQFAQHTKEPCVYFVGRSEEAGDRIRAECKNLNPEGEYNFIKADTSLIRNVDKICRDIKNKETSVNLLFLSSGVLIGREITSENLVLGASLFHYSRARFIVDLLPLLQRAHGLRRVVSVFTGTKEGDINMDDLQCRNVKTNRIHKVRGHGASLVTLSLEALAAKAPDVSFIHDFPGPVKSGIARNGQGMIVYMIKVSFTLFGPSYIPTQESGERHLFVSTSGRWPAATGEAADQGVPLANGVEIARGTTGKDGSGMYSVDWDGQSAGPQVEQLLANYRREGLVEKVWNDAESQYKRITGVIAE